MRDVSPEVALMLVLSVVAVAVLVWTTQVP
jgi:hypothetical protein